MIDGRLSSIGNSFPSRGDLLHNNCSVSLIRHAARISPFGAKSFVKKSHICDKVFWLKWDYVVAKETIEIEYCTTNDTSESHQSVTAD